MGRRGYDKTDSPSRRSSSLPERDTVDTRFSWKLEDIYASGEEWERDFTAIPGLIDDLRSHSGRLGETAARLCEALQARDRLAEAFYRLFVYAHLLRDQDTRNPDSQALAERVARAGTQVREAFSFLSPEILSLPDGRVARYLEEEEGLALYRHDLADILRVRDHVLSPPEEKLLALAGNMAAAPRNIFHMLNNADIRFPTIRDESGEDVELTKGRFSRFMESTDRRVRRDAYRALLGTYRSYANTLAATLGGSVTQDVFFARARRYPSTLDAALDRDNIPKAVYETTLRVVRENIDPLRRYHLLRKRILGYEELRPYDLFVPLFPEVDEEIPFERAVETVIEGLEPLGQSYGEVLRRAIASRWIDVYETRGKRSGAYSWGAYGIHPYVLLNYQAKLDDVFTLAHELGHAMHSHYTTNAQPYVYSDYSIFTAEVASTTNEAILMDHLLKGTKEREKKLFLLNHYLDQIRGTVYTQVLFAEFERSIHEIAERDEPLTSDSMSELFRDLHREFVGDLLAEEPDQSVYWTRIPHFYSGFYVYQYATGYAAATALSQKILREGEPALRRYLDLLRSGSSRYPIDLLRDAGVDMTSPEPLQETIRLFDRLLGEMEELVGHG